MGHFNLIREPWIPCVATDGEPIELSLRELFAQATTIRGVTGDIPQQVMPMLRIALAVLYGAYADRRGDCDEMCDLWVEVWESDGFDMARIDAYLSRYEDRFDLLDECRPFFQTPDLQYTAKDVDPLEAIIADVPKADRTLFSMRSGSGVASVSFAEAARWLAFVQAYDTAGIKSPVVGNTHVTNSKVYAPKGAVGTGWLGAIGGIFVEGDNLFQTLVLNWVLYDPSTGDDADVLLGRDGDEAPWQKDDAPTTDMVLQGSFHGVVDALTLQARRVRLVVDEEHGRVTGCVVCYGDIVHAYDNNRSEQMTAWYLSANQAKKLGRNNGNEPMMPRTHIASRNLWRGLAPVLQASGGRHRELRPGVISWLEEMQRYAGWRSDEHSLGRVTLHAQGMTYGTQSSIFDASVDDSLRIDSVMFRYDYDGVKVLLEVIDKTEESVRALADFVRNLHIASGQCTNSQAARDDVVETAYAQMDAMFRDRIARFTEDQDAELYGKRWQDDVHRSLLAMAQRYLDQSPAQAFGAHIPDNRGGKGSPMTSGRALLELRGALNGILGAVAVPETASDDNKLEGDDNGQ